MNEGSGGAVTRPESPLRVGLTGGIACGKSRVLRTLAARGCSTLDLDDVSRLVMSPGGAAFGPVVEAFGPGVLGPDGTIDRPRLGRRVFGDPEARARLEAIVHPAIRREELRWVSASPSRSGGVFVSDGALLVETGLHLRYDRLVVVHTTPDVQIARLRARDGLDEAAARGRIAAQMPAPEKARFGHHRIDTGGTPRETDSRAERLAARLLEQAAEPVRRSRLSSERIAACAAAAASEGLSIVLLEELSSAGGPDLRRLSERLRGEAPSDWYAGAPVPGAGAGLGPLLAVWGLARRGDDADYLSGAAYALGRALGLPPAELADLCLAALTAARVALRGLDENAPGQLRVLLRRQAADWGGEEPSEVVEQALREAMGGGAVAEGLAGAYSALAGSVPCPPGERERRAAEALVEAMGSLEF